MSVSALSLAEVAGLTGGRVAGDATVQIRDVAPLREAGADELGLLADRGYLKVAAGSRAGAFLAAAALEDRIPEDRPAVIVKDAHAALIPLLEHLHPAALPAPGVHPTAVIGQGVQLGSEVTVGPYAVLGDRAVVGDRARIGSHVVVGQECRVGEDSVLYSHVVLYARTVVGRRVTMHAGARLGVDGFGYTMQEGTYRKVPQVGRVVVEDDVEIGANSCIDRGSLGDTVVGRGTKLDNLIHLAHNVRVGEHSVMAAQVGIAGSTRIGSHVSFGGQAGVAGHLEIGDRARIAAQAGVIGDVEAEATVTGYPARDLKTWMRAAAHMLRLPALVREVKDLRRTVEAMKNAAGAGRASDDPSGS